MHEQEKERNDLYIHHLHGISWNNLKDFVRISPPNVLVQVEMQRQATESMKQKVGMGAMGQNEKTSKWDESRWRKFRYFFCVIS